MNSINIRTSIFDAMAHSLVITQSRALFYTLLLLLMTGCATKSGCREGDSWGSNDTTFQSRFANPKDAAYIVPGQQLIKWQNTNLVTNGEPVVIEIDGRWSPWGREAMIIEETRFDENNIAYVSTKESDLICRDLPTTTVSTYTGSVTAYYMTLDNPSATNGGFPCWVSNGMGLYLLFQRAGGEQEPNSNATIVKSPISPTVHLFAGYRENRFALGDTRSLYNPDGTAVSVEKDMQIYGKILDSYYKDNEGEYSLRFLSGVKPEAKDSVFEAIREFIVGDVIANVQSQFNNIINNGIYRKTVYLALVIFVSLMGLAYIIGMIQSNIGEFALRIFKIGLVLTLLTPDAWNFLNNTLFSLYLKGADEIVNIILGNKNYNPKKPMAFLDTLVTRDVFNKDVTMDRFASMLSANLILGVIWCALMVTALMFFGFFTLYCFAVYCVSIFILGFITLVFPVAAIFMLFAITKDIFTGWLNLVISYTAQIIMLFVVLVFFAEMIKYEFYRSMGYKICAANWLRLLPTARAPEDVSKNRAESLINWPMFVPGEAEKYVTVNYWYFGLNMYQLFISKRFDFKYYDIRYMLIPPYYKKKEFRYKSLPYLNPQENQSTNGNMSPALLRCVGGSLEGDKRRRELCNPDIVFKDGIGEPDHDKIKSMMFSDTPYTFIDFMDVAVIGIFLAILWNLGMKFIQKIAEYIALGGDGFVPDGATVGEAIRGGFAQWERFVEKGMGKIQEIKGPVGKGLGIVAGLAASFVTTDGLSKFVGEKVKSLRKQGSALSGKAGGLGGDLLREGLGIKEGSGVDSALGSIGGFLYNHVGDVLRYDTSNNPGSTSKSLERAVRDAEQEEMNLKGIDWARDGIGNVIDFANAKLDQTDAESLTSTFGNYGSYLRRFENMADFHTDKQGFARFSAYAQHVTNQFFTGYGKDLVGDEHGFDMTRSFDMYDKKDGHENFESFTRGTEDHYKALQSKYDLTHNTPINPPMDNAPPEVQPENTPLSVFSGTPDPDPIPSPSPMPFPPEPPSHSSLSLDDSPDDLTLHQQSIMGDVPHLYNHEPYHQESQQGHGTIEGPYSPPSDDVMGAYIPTGRESSLSADEDYFPPSPADQLYSPGDFTPPSASTVDDQPPYSDVLSVHDLTPPEGQSSYDVTDQLSTPQDSTYHPEDVPKSLGVYDASHPPLEPPSYINHTLSTKDNPLESPHSPGSMDIKQPSLGAPSPHIASIPPSTGLSDIPTTATPGDSTYPPTSTTDTQSSTSAIPTTISPKADSPSMGTEMRRMNPETAPEFTTYSETQLKEMQPIEKEIADLNAEIESMRQDQEGSFDSDNSPELAIERKKRQILALQQKINNIITKGSK